MKLNMNLQFFADEEKTEVPTPKKRKDTREEGQILQSKEVTAAFMLLSAFVGLKFFGKYIVSYLLKFMTSTYKTIENVDKLFYENNLMIEFTRIVAIFLGLIAPMLAVAFISALVFSYLQVGFLFTTKPLKPKLSRLNPIEGFKRLFSKKALAELVKSMLKILLIGYVFYSFMESNVIEMIRLSRLEPENILKNSTSLAYSLSMKIARVLIALGFMDYIFQWRQHEEELKMTKHEIKEEHKQTDGDPQIKSKIRERQRRMAMSRMMQDVPDADVIITNPTHIAIAIKYDAESYQAPYILAKGVNMVAENIKKVGGENSIPIIENKPLARALNKSAEIGDIIPEELYEAVAEVLAYVYNLKDNF